MVTLEPTLRSPVILVLLSRASSHLSLPFCTVMVVGVISSTGPVTWYDLRSAALRQVAAKSAVPHMNANQCCFILFIECRLIRWINRVVEWLFNGISRLLPGPRP